MIMWKVVLEIKFKSNKTNYKAAEQLPNMVVWINQLFLGGFWGLMYLMEILTKYSIGYVVWLKEGANYIADWTKLCNQNKTYMHM